MKNRYEHVVVPENKEHYLWIFLVLFSILIFEFVLYPKVSAIALNSKLARSFKSQLKIYTDKTSQARGKTEKEFNNLESEEKAFFKIKGSVKEEFSNKFLGNKGFNITKVNFSKSINSHGIAEYPVYIEIRCTMSKLKEFLPQLIDFGNPVDISSMQIDNLSAQELFAKIEIVIKEIKKINE